MKLSSRKSTVFIALAAIALALNLGDSFARGGGGGGGHGFSGGGRSVSAFRSASPASSSGFFKSSPSRSVAPAPSVPKPVAVAPSQPVKPGFKTMQPAAPAPMAKTFDAAGAKANHEASSRQAFKAAQPPVQTAVAKPYEYKRDAYVQNLRSELAGAKWQNRQLRQDQAFGGYYNRPSAPIFAQPAYHDPFGNMFFWMWLMDRPHERDTWLYHHQSEVDPARLAEMKAKDADLDRRLKALETSGVKRDSAYTPTELSGNRDLMYSDDVVKDAAKAEHSMSALWIVLGGVLFLAALSYLVFVHRWK